jgi:hypothetical protein
LVPPHFHHPTLTPQAKKLVRLAVVLTVVLVLQLACNFGLVWSVVAANTQTHVSSSNPVLLVKGTTQPVQVANSDFYVDASGHLVSRSVAPYTTLSPSRRRLFQSPDPVPDAGPSILSTATATQILTAADDPTLAVPVHFNMYEPTSGATFHLNVNGFALAGPGDMFLFTDVGDVHFDGKVIQPLDDAFASKFAALRSAYASSLASGRRLLTVSGAVYTGIIGSYMSGANAPTPSAGVWCPCPPPWTTIPYASQYTSTVLATNCSTWPTANFPCARVTSIKGTGTGTGTMSAGR